MRFFYFLLIFLPCLAQGQITIELNENKHREIIPNSANSYGSLGVALGGGSKTLLEYKYYSSLYRLNPTGIRLEAVTADYRFLYDPVSNKWNYDMLDKELNHINKSAFIMANIFYTPKFLSSCPKSKNYAYCPPSDLHAWTEYVKEIVKHTYSKYGVKYWEIGNEPSGKNFFRAPLKDFFNFYIVTAKAIKEVSSDIMVGGFADNAYYIDAYYDFFKYIRSHDPDLLNFVTFHWYGDWGLKNKYDPSEVNSITNNIRAKLIALNMSNVPIFLTEWNLRAEGPQKNGYNQITAYFIAMQYWIHISKLKRTFFFRVEPYSSTMSSLLDSHGKNTGLGNIFTDLIDMYRTYDIQFAKKNDIYIFFSPSQKKILVTRYELHSNKIKELKLIVRNSQCSTPVFYYAYIDEKKIAQRLDVFCLKNKLNIKLSLSNFQSGVISY